MTIASPTDAEALAWIRRKLKLPVDAQMFHGQETIAGALHVMVAHAHGYVTYIEAFRCDDKQGEIARLTVRAEKAEDERDVYRTLARVGTWCDGCRPNRKMASRELAKSQAVIDKLADRISKYEKFLSVFDRAVDVQTSAQEGGVGMSYRFDIGARVVLNSGGPVMWVVKHGTRRHADRDDTTEYCCEWPDTDGKVWSKWFGGETITAVGIDLAEKADVTGVATTATAQD